MADSERLFTIFVLLYGDYPELASRCLDPIVEHIPGPALDLRVGCNSVSSRTAEYVQGLIDRGSLEERHCYRSEKNILKYPMMRRMFYDDKSPIATPYVVWFDDDSYLDLPLLRRVPCDDECYCSFFSTLRDAMAGADMVGGLYEKDFTGGQRDWVRMQSWYCGKPSRERLKFCTGGFWAIRTEVLSELDFPWPALEHRGGDTMLGEALYQLGKRRGEYSKYVRINAAASGKESKAARRGYDSPPIGHFYSASAQPVAATQAKQEPRLRRIELDI